MALFGNHTMTGTVSRYQLVVRAQNRVTWMCIILVIYVMCAVCRCGVSFISARFRKSDLSTVLCMGSLESVRSG
jgi:hypothetical protein